VLVTAPGKEEESATRLGRIGFDRIAGYLKGGVAAAHARAAELVRGKRVDREALAKRLAAPQPPQVVDVRTNMEWSAGHIDGALHLVLDDLSKNLAAVPRDRELVVVCKSGYRSSIAASLLQAAGFERVTDLTGGMDAWNATSGAGSR
jgi:rhodanese-related sulfurtransferase